MLPKIQLEGQESNFEVVMHFDRVSHTTKLFKQIHLSVGQFAQHWAFELDPLKEALGSNNQPVGPTAIPKAVHLSTFEMYSML
jgi:hypothetical protein